MKKIILDIILCLSLYPGFAQLDSSRLRDSSINQLMAIQKNILGENSVIYYGREYTDYDHQIEGDPYFLTDTMVESSVYYSGSNFRDLRMLYNINLDDIIIYNPYKKQMITLPSEKIDSFSFLGHLFVWISKDSSSMNMLSPGFYDMPYSGTSIVLIRQIKSIIRPINPKDPTRFVQKTSYYIKRNGNYFSVDSKKKLMDVFQDKKKEILKYLHAHKLKYKKDPENTLVKTAQYYDQIK